MEWCGAHVSVVVGAKRQRTRNAGGPVRGKGASEIFDSSKRKKRWRSRYNGFPATSRSRRIF